MEDWNRQRNHNGYPPLHAYALGVFRQQSTEQTNGNLNWTNAGVMDLSNYNTGAPRTFYIVNVAKNPDESPPERSGQQTGSGHFYLGDTQSSCSVPTAPSQAESRRAQSESPTYSDLETSPDSWRSDSSRDESFPQVDPTTWAKKEPDFGVCGKGPISSQDVSPPIEPTSFIEEPQPLAHAPIATPVKQNTATRAVKKSFSESQMSVLVQRFSAQKYLPPAEMKNIADMIGLTYKQVKTWFQNRRMKLRRHQKDNKWMCGRYNVNKGLLLHGNMYNISSPHVPPLQDPRPQENHNQYVMEAAYTKPAPQNVAYYMAPIGNAAGPTGYPAWSPQVNGWCFPQHAGHYENNTFNPPAADGGNDSSFENQDREAANSLCSSDTSVDPRPQENHNQYVMEAAYTKPAPQNVAYYMAPIGNAAGPTGYPAWSPQVNGWCFPQHAGHYENNTFNPPAANDGNDSSFENQDGEAANSLGTKCNQPASQ